MPDPVYLDYNATTPMDPRVLEAMIPWFLKPSNAGSRTHSFGQAARDAVENARQQIANVLGARSEEVYFTSGATESNNIAILGLTDHGERTGRRHLLSTPIEHKAILEPLAVMKHRGFDVEFAPVTRGGYVEPDEIKKRLRSDTLLVSVMHANNETGVLQPIREIGEMLAATDTFFHTDAAQTFGKDGTLKDVLFDIASASSHKIYGPQGVGALCLRRRKFLRIPVTPLAHGGGQERGLRHGTVPTASIVGFGLAAELSIQEWSERQTAAIRMRDQLMAELSKVEHAVNGDRTRRQPHILNVSFPGVDSEALMMAVRRDFAISNGSACTSNSYVPSHVLRAMQINEELISESVRISWGRGVEEVCWQALTAAVEKLRNVR